MKIKKHRKNNKILLIGISLFIITIIMNTIKSICIDSDTFFLINTGKYIIQNKEIPTINPWVIHENFGIVVQQWVCDIFNYLAYSIGGFNGIFVLTIINSIILGIIYYRYIGMFCNNIKKKYIIFVIFMMLMLSRWGNSRPTLITAVIICIEQIILYRYYNSNNREIKDFIKLAIKLCIVSIVQINYHASMWFMTILLILPYMASFITESIKKLKDIKIYLVQPLNNERNNSKEIIRTLILIICIMITSLINPNGIKAPLYFFNSYEAANELNINEMQPVSINSIKSICIIYVIVLLIVLIIKRKVSEQLLYLTVGTLILAIQHERNIWFLCFSFIQLTAIMLNSIDIEKFNIKINIAIQYIILGINCFCMISSLVNLKIDFKDEIMINSKSIEYLNQYNKDNIRLFTTFNNGAGFEFNGFKVYIDARPEIFNDKISGADNILEEYIELDYNHSMYNDVINKYKFTHIACVTESFLNVYLEWQDTPYEKVVDTEIYCLWERKDFKENID